MVNMEGGKRKKWSEEETSDTATPKPTKIPRILEKHRSEEKIMQPESLPVTLPPLPSGRPRESIVPEKPFNLPLDLLSGCETIDSNATYAEESGGAIVNPQDILEDIHKKTPRLSRYQARDISHLGKVMTDYLESFLPYPAPAKGTPSWQLNKLYEFNEWLYDDLQDIKFLVKYHSQPCLATIQMLFHRLYIATLPRLRMLRRAKAKLVAKDDLQSLREFFCAFNNKRSKAILKPVFKKGVRLEAHLFNRAAELNKLVNLCKKARAQLSADNGVFKEIQNELEHHLERIEDHYIAVSKYFFILQLQVPYRKTVRPASTTESSLYDEFKQRCEADDALGKMGLRMPTQLNTEIRNAVTRGDSQTAWLRLRVLKLSGYFHAIPSRPTATLPIQKFKTILDPRLQEEIDAELLANAKRVVAEDMAANDTDGFTMSVDTTEVEELFADAKIRMAAKLAADKILEKQYRKELIDAGYGTYEEGEEESDHLDGPENHNPWDISQADFAKLHPEEQAYRLIMAQELFDAHENLKKEHDALKAELDAIRGNVGED